MASLGYVVSNQTSCQFVGAGMLVHSFYPPNRADRKNLSGDGNSLILSPTALKIPLPMV